MGVININALNLLLKYSSKGCHKTLKTQKYLELPKKLLKRQIKP